MSNHPPESPQELGVPQTEPPSSGGPVLEFWNSGSFGKLTLIGGGLLICGLIGFFSGIGPGIFQTSTPSPTPTSEPTATTVSTPEDIELIEPGRHLVDSGIEPGIYQGEGRFCYWVRLRDLFGNADSAIANGNASGQYYFEVKSSDLAIETSCSIASLDKLPAPSGDKPTILMPGMYLVGRDILPGTYRGEAETDFCYWRRLANVSGDTGSVIANGESDGRYSVEVSSSDFAFDTTCQLERTGD